MYLTALRAAADRQGVECYEVSPTVSLRSVSRSASVVSEGQNPNRTIANEIYDMIGKSLHRCTPRRQVSRDKGNRSASLGKPADSIEGHCNFLVGLGLYEQGGRHYFPKRPSIRCLTCPQGAPADSPASTRRARRSISMAQALSTSSRLSAGSSSRLASSSAATSARSVWGSFRASCKRASRVIGSSLPSGAWHSTNGRVP